jgi:hypothetical protein
MHRYTGWTENQVVSRFAGRGLIITTRLDRRNYAMGFAWMPVRSKNEGQNCLDRIFHIFMYFERRRWCLFCDGLERAPRRGKDFAGSQVELTDTKKHVRAVFAVEDDGSVSLRMLSNDNVPVVELGVNEDRGGVQNRYTPSGGLTIRDGEGTQVIRLRTVNKGDGALSFSSARTEDQVAVGYMPYGDVIGEHDLARWGIAVRGPDHKSIGLGVFTEDGIMQGFKLQLQAPPSVPPK